MNILIGNYYYFLKGGSERVFFHHCKLMNQEGHNVIPFSVRHENNLPSSYQEYFAPSMSFECQQGIFSKAKVAARIIYSIESKKQVQRLIKDCRPDLAHMHNIYHRISPSALTALREHRIPTILTLHDYKLICPVYLLYRKDICEECKGKRFYQCILHKCNKGSVALSSISATELYVHSLLKLWTNYVFSFVTPSQFLKNKLIEYGFDEAAIRCIPNFIFPQDYKPDYENQGYITYVGRLSKEKGIHTLIHAFHRKSRTKKLLIVGDGPMRGKLEDIAGNEKSGVTFTGYISGTQLKKIVRKSMAVVLPSEWYENAPMSVLEAFAYGKPVIASRVGGLPEMVEDGINGFLFEPGNVLELNDKLSTLFNMSKAAITDMGHAARNKLEAEYNPELHYQRLMSLYYEALVRA